MLQTSDYTYNIDSPKNKTLLDRKVELLGWVIPHNKTHISSLRLKNANQIIPIKYGLEREDVAMAFPELNNNKTLHSGFSLEFECLDKDAVIEVDTGDGYRVLHRFEFDLSPNPTTLNYNPFLASNWADHTDLINVKSSYFYEDERAYDIPKNTQKPNLVAFYLPQFHPIPENDKAWGTGFTEWRNVTTGQPRFVGHHQPILPRDLGYYDLRLDSVIEQQIKLAKDHGIYGFCFYYYWFSGKKLLESPLASFLRHKEWDFNFMICWANENWTKRWDGRDNEVIVEQKYKKSDPLDFIKEVEPILLDKRYIRVDGKPALVVYRPEHTKAPKEYTTIWREYFMSKHGIDLHLINVMSFAHEDMRDQGFDSAIEFVPASVDYRYRKLYNQNPPRAEKSYGQLIDASYQGAAYDYRKVVLNDEMHDYAYNFPTYNCVMPGWDNEARKKGNGTSYHLSNPDLYYKWLDRVLDQRKKKDDLVFINAWNEWAEGTVLEPTMHYGHAILNRTAEAVIKHSSGYSKNSHPYTQAVDKIHDRAVLVTLSNVSELPHKEYFKNLNNCKADIVILVDSLSSVIQSDIKSVLPGAKIKIFPNRGRDILPFIQYGRRFYEQGYVSLMKLNYDGSIDKPDTLKATLGQLIGSENAVRDNFKRVESEDSVVFPRSKGFDWEKNIETSYEVLTSILSSIYGDDAEKIASELKENSSMQHTCDSFVSTIKLWEPLFNLYLMPEDFPPESLQDSATIVQAISMSYTSIAKKQSGKIYLKNKLGILKKI